MGSSFAFLWFACGANAGLRTASAKGAILVERNVPDQPLRIQEVSNVVVKVAMFRDECPTPWEKIIAAPVNIPAVDDMQRAIVRLSKVPSSFSRGK